MHHASCPGAPPPIRPSTHSKASGHSCHSNNKNSTTAPRLHPPSATPWTPVKKHLTLIPIPTPHLSKFSHLAINVDWWVISSTVQRRVTMSCAAYIMIFFHKYCCISPSLASIVAPSSLPASCPPVRLNISRNLGSRCAKSLIVVWIILMDDVWPTAGESSTTPYATPTRLERIIPPCSGDGFCWQATTPIAIGEEKLAKLAGRIACRRRPTRRYGYDMY